MSSQRAKYALIGEQNDFRDNFNWIRICIMVAIYIGASLVVYTTWNSIYQHSISIPPKFTDIPYWWYTRTELYSYYLYNKTESSTVWTSSPSSSLLSLESNGIVNENSLTPSLEIAKANEYPKVKIIENEKIYPSKLGNFIPSAGDKDIKIVCYYSAPNTQNKMTDLQPKNIDPYLCTHINVGIVNIVNNSLEITENLRKLFTQVNELKIENKKLKVLLWVGGAEVGGFPEMVKNHRTRKLFIQSLKSVLERYRLDGIDLDWEFPSAYRREKQHFSQLLHEIRREYEREHRTYILSVAVAAPEGIVYFAYNIREINNYVDYVNIMTYDFHFYSKGSPFTGLNAPLFARQNEKSILSTLNINYTVNYWIKNGLDKNKVNVGLPTYGHSFRLVNPYNTGIGAPAEDIGRVGMYGFASYAEICWFNQNNIYVTTVFDSQTCSPYMYAGIEWISFEDERSLECKAKYIKDNGFGGVVIFSLNTDDFGSHCEIGKYRQNSKYVNKQNNNFPLIRKIRSILLK